MLQRGEEGWVPSVVYICALICWVNMLTRQPWKTLNAKWAYGPCLGGWDFRKGKDLYVEKAKEGVLWGYFQKNWRINPDSKTSNGSFYVLTESHRGLPSRPTHVI